MKQEYCSSTQFM